MDEQKSNSGKGTLGQCLFTLSDQMNHLRQLLKIQIPQVHHLEIQIQQVSLGTDIYFCKLFS